MTDALHPAAAARRDERARRGDEMLRRFLILIGWVVPRCFDPRELEEAAALQAGRARDAQGEG